MKPHPRIRKFIMWGGLVVSVVLLSLWVGNAYGWFFSTMQRGFSLDAFRGQIMFVLFLDGGQMHRTWTELVRASPTGFNWFGMYKRTANALYFVIPIWPFVLTSIATTAAAWRMDTLAQRRKRLGTCPTCGYDRTGLAANAPCPECNSPTR